MVLSFILESSDCCKAHQHSSVGDRYYSRTTKCTNCSVATNLAQMPEWFEVIATGDIIACQKAGMDIHSTSYRNGLIVTKIV